MKITIDTKEDSHEDIIKVIQILQHFASNKTITEHVDTTNMMDMFDTPVSSSSASSGSSSASSRPQYQDQLGDVDKAPDFRKFLSMAEKKEAPEKKDDELKIQFF